MSLWKKAAARSSAWLSFEAFGVAMVVELNSPDLRAQVQERLPPGWRQVSEKGDAARVGLRQSGLDDYEVAVDGQAWLEHAPLDVALGMLDGQIRMQIAMAAKQWIFVHAGVVAQADRISNSGKGLQMLLEELASTSPA